MRKETVIYARVSAALKERLRAAAADRGEAESVIVREALNEYFERRDRLGKPFAASDASRSPRTSTDSLNDAAPRSAIRNPQSAIRNPQSTFPVPPSRKPRK